MHKHPKFDFSQCPTVKAYLQKKLGTQQSSHSANQYQEQQPDSTSVAGILKKYRENDEFALQESTASIDNTKSDNAPGMFHNVLDITTEDGFINPDPYLNARNQSKLNGVNTPFHNPVPNYKPHTSGRSLIPPRTRTLTENNGSTASAQQFPPKIPRLLAKIPLSSTDNANPNANTTTATVLEKKNASQGENNLSEEQAERERDLLSCIISTSSKKLEDVEGCEEAKEALEHNVIFPMLNPAIHSGLLAPVKGILLFGPPGNGKTMMAKAVAGECGEDVTFFNISSATIMSKWLGDGERSVQTLFKLARQKQPSIIFIDEVDSLLSERRGDGEHGAERRIKTEFLVQMDGCANDENSERVLVLGATNRPYELDEAILRRFPERIFIDLPNAKARASMLRNTFFEEKNVRLNDQDFDHIAAQTENFSFFDLRQLCRKAAQFQLKGLGREQVRLLSPRRLPPITLKSLHEAQKHIRPSCVVENRRKLLAFAQKYAQQYTHQFTEENGGEKAINGEEKNELSK